MDKSLIEGLTNLKYDELTQYQQSEMSILIGIFIVVLLCHGYFSVR